METRVFLNILSVVVVLPLGFKVINVKNLHSKNLKRKLIFFNSLTSVIAEFSTSNFIFVISLQKKIEPSVFFLSILQLIWQDLAIACKSFNWRKSINRWNLMNEQNQPNKKLFCKKKIFLKTAVLQSINLIV